MAYLTEKEKSILFSAIHREEKVCKEHGFDDLVKVCKRLTHLFSYNRFEKDIRKKAIDDFAERIKEHTKVVGSTTCEDLDEIAKRMKGE